MLGWNYGAREGDGVALRGRIKTVPVQRERDGERDGELLQANTRAILGRMHVRSKGCDSEFLSLLIAIRHRCFHTLQLPSRESSRESDRILAPTTAPHRCQASRSFSRSQPTRACPFVSLVTPPPFPLGAAAGEIVAGRSDLGVSRVLRGGSRRLVRHVGAERLEVRCGGDVRSGTRRRLTLAGDGGFGTRGVGGLDVAPAALLLLVQLRQTARLVVDVEHLLLGLGVEGPYSVARRRVHGLLEVTLQAAEAGLGAVRDAVCRVGRLGAFRCLDAVVEVGQRGREAIGEAMLLVELDRPLQRLVPDAVSLCDVLGQDAGAGLVLLAELPVVLADGFARRWALSGRKLVETLGRLDGDRGRPKVGFVEEKSRPRGAELSIRADLTDRATDDGGPLTLPSRTSQWQIWGCLGLRTRE